LPPERLSEQDIQSVVLTTHAAALFANDPSIRGAVQDWKLLTSCSWYKRYIALIFCIFNTLPVLTGLNVPYSAAASESDWVAQDRDYIT